MRCVGSLEVARSGNGSGGGESGTHVFAARAGHGDLQKLVDLSRVCQSLVWRVVVWSSNDQRRPLLHLVGSYIKVKVRDIKGGVSYIKVGACSLIKNAGRNKELAKKPDLYPWTSRQIKEGRGQGTGASYRSWIHVRDFSSRGKSNRLKSWKSGRTLQLLSDLELGLAYLLDWSDSVVDYYEQYPLLPLDETLKEGESLGYPHPIDGDTGEPRVRTTDFLIHLRIAGADRMVARSVKPAEDLKVKKPVLGLELERRFWARRNIDWAIVTENELPKDMVKNIEWVHDARTLEDHEEISSLPLQEILPVLRGALDAADQPLAHTCLGVDRKLGLAPGNSLFLVRHQLATKAWRIDMRQPIRTQNVLCLLDEHRDDVFSERGAA